MAVPERATSESDERRWIALLLFAAFVVRMAWLGELATLPWAEQLPTDSFLYDQAARRIANGDWLLGDRPLRMSPAYFYVVGLVHVVCGSGVWAIRLLQVAAGVATVFVTWRVAKQLVTARWALLAAGLVAFAGPLVFFDGAILPESLSTLLLVSVAWLSLRALERRDVRKASQWSPWAAVGLALGLLSTLRPNAILLLPVSMLLAWRAPVDRSERVRRAASVLIAAMIAIAPITARNAIASGRFVPLTSHGGVNFFVGNGPGANGTFRVPAEVPGGGSPSTQFDAFREAASQAMGREVDETESDAYWQRRTLAHVSAHPLDATVLVARKIHLLFNARELGLVLPYAFSREATRTMGAPLVQSGWLAPLALVGLLLALFRRHDDDERVARERAVATFTLVFALSIALVFVTDRYRAPLLPLFAIHAVSVIERVASAARARAWRFVGVIAVAFALAVAVAVPVRANQHFEREWLALGDGFLELDEPSRALDAYEHALALSPEDPLARRGVERAAAALGDAEPRGR